MEILEVGEKLDGKEYPYRKTCFAIIDCGDKFMLVYTEKDRNHSLPGGGIEEGETPLEAIKREVIEEAGCKIKKAEEIVQVHCYWNWKNGLKNLERFAHIFVVEIEEEMITPLEDWHTRVYVDKKDAINLIPFPYQKAAIEYYLKNLKK